MSNKPSSSPIVDAQNNQNQGPGLPSNEVLSSGYSYMYPQGMPLYAYPPMNMSMVDHHLMNKVYAEQNNIYMSKVAPYLPQGELQDPKPILPKSSSEGALPSTFSEDSLFDLTETFFSLDSLLDDSTPAPMEGGILDPPAPDFASFFNVDIGETTKPFAPQVHHSKPAPLQIPPRAISRLREEDRGELSSPLKRSRRSFEEDAAMSPASALSSAYEESPLDIFDDEVVGEEERTKKRRRVTRSESADEAPTPRSGSTEEESPQKQKSSLMCLGRVKRKRLPKVYDSMVLRFQCM